MFLNKKDVQEIVDGVEDRLADKIKKESEDIYSYVRDMLSNWSEFSMTMRKGMEDKMLQYTNGLSKQIEILADQVGDAQEGIINISSDMLTQSDYESSMSHESINQDYQLKLKAKIEQLEKEKADLQTQNAVLTDNVDDLRVQLSKKDAYLNKLIEINKDKDKSIWEIAGALSAVTEGVFREDCVEFACLKTYRGGWQYIYINGEQAKDFRMAQNLCLYWAEGEPVNLEMNVESRKN